MTQSESILLHLRKNKTITPLEALRKYGIFRLAARIEELRKRGFNIQTEYVRNKKKVFGQYSIEKV